MGTNLFSLMAAYDRGYETRITPGHGLRVFYGKEQVLQATWDSTGLFRFRTTTSYAMTAQVPERTMEVTERTKDLDLDIWHQQLAHLNKDDVKKLAKMVDGMRIKVGTTVGVCEPCLEGKQTRQPSHQPATRATELLELIHSDTCGPIHPVTYGGTKYYVSFMDDHSRMTRIYPLKNKSSAVVLEKFMEFKTEVEKQTGSQIKRLRTDGGGEYEKWMKAHLKGLGIIHETTAPYSPDQNGVAERVNRTIMERVKAIIAESKLDKRRWMEITDSRIAVQRVQLQLRPTKSGMESGPISLISGSLDRQRMSIFQRRSVPNSTHIHPRES